MGGKETKGDYYLSLERSLNLQAEFVEVRVTPQRLAAMQKVAKGLKQKGLTYPDLQFVNPQTATQADAEYSIKPYKMAIEDERTLKALTDIISEKTDYYRLQGLSNELIEDVVNVIIDTTLHEVASREKQRKQIVASEIAASKSRKESRPKRGVMIDPVVVEKAKSEIKISRESLMKAGLPEGTANKILRGQTRVSEETAGRLAIATGLSVADVVKDKKAAGSIKRNMEVFCREILGNKSTTSKTNGEIEDSNVVFTPDQNHSSM